MNDWALLVLRLGLGVIFLVHGLQKQKMWKLQPSAQLPAPLLRTLRLLAIAEPAGALALFAGLLTQAASAGFVLVMLGAIRLKALVMKKAFTGDGGWELDFVILVAAVVLIVTGGGRFALDRVLFGI